MSCGDHYRSRRPGRDGGGGRICDLRAHSTFRAVRSLKLVLDVPVGGTVVTVVVGRWSWSLCRYLDRRGFVPDADEVSLWITLPLADTVHYLDRFPHLAWFLTVVPVPRALLGMVTSVCALGHKSLVL